MTWKNTKVVVPSIGNLSLQPLGLVTWGKYTGVVSIFIWLVTVQISGKNVLSSKLVELWVMARNKEKL